MAESQAMQGDIERYMTWQRTHWYCEVPTCRVVDCVDPKHFVKASKIEK